MRVDPPQEMVVRLCASLASARVTLRRNHLARKWRNLADAPDLGSGSRKAMGVRVPPFALLRSPRTTRRAAECKHREKRRRLVHRSAVGAKVEVQAPES